MSRWDDLTRESQTSNLMDMLREAMKKREGLQQQEQDRLDNKQAHDQYDLFMGRTEGLQKQTLENTGSLARQKLASDFGLQGTKYTADIGLQGHKYTADIGLEGQKLTSGAAITASENRLAGDTRRAVATENAATIGLGKTDARAKLLETWAGGTNPTLENLNVMMAGYDKLYPAKKPERVSGAGFIQPDSATPTASGNSLVTPVSVPPPARASLTTPKNDEPGLPQAAIGLANWFSPEEVAKRRKKLYYGE